MQKIQGLKYHKTYFTYYVGIILTILGSFLPWKIEGDLIPIVTNGISIHGKQVSPWLRGISEFPMKDNGGLLILLFSGAVFVLTFYTPKYIKHPKFFIFALTILQVLFVFYHIASLLYRRAQLNYEFWAPGIRSGLVMVTLGALLMLSTAILSYHNKRQ